MATLNFKTGLSDQQRTSITNLLKSGRSLNETDARNLAYATGQGNWQQFLGKSASNYSIGNLAQFVTPQQGNINPQKGSSFIFPNMGKSTMAGFFDNITNTGISNLEQSILNLANQRELARQERQTAAQKRYDTAFTGLEGAYNAESGESLMRRLMAEQGIEAKQNQLVEFQKQMAQLQNDFTNVTNAIGSQPINTAIIRGQQYLKQQEYAAKGSLIQSQAAIVEGQLNFATDIVKGYYEAATADRNAQIGRYTTLLDLAKNDLVDLKQDEKENISLFISTLQQAETRQQENKDKILDLLTGDEMAQIAWSKTPDISLDMSYEEIVKKLIPQMAAERLRQFGILHKGSSGVSSGSTVTGKITGNDFTSDAQSVASYLSNLRNSNQLNDINYDQKISELMDKYEIDPGQYEQTKSMVNRMMEGSFGQTQIGTQEGSDFQTLAPTQSLGAFGFPSGTSAGTALGLGLRETPSTLKKAYKKSSDIQKQFYDFWKGLLTGK